MDRRKFFSFLPLGAVVVGAAVIAESQKQDKPADNNANTLRLMGMKQNTKDPYNDRSAMMFLGETPRYVIDDNTHVTMAVGQDGNLWLKSADGDWKRIVTEG